jgi:hypothetical protein
VPEADAARRIELRWVRANGATVKIQNIGIRRARMMRRVKRFGWIDTDKASANDVLRGKGKTSDNITMWKCGGDLPPSDTREYESNVFEKTGEDGKRNGS